MGVAVAMTCTQVHDMSLNGQDIKTERKYAMNRIVAALRYVQVRDMSLNEQDGKLVACSCNNSFVGVWVVDLDKIRPWSGPAVRKAPANQSEHSSSRLVVMSPV